MWCDDEILSSMNLIMHKWTQFNTFFRLFSIPRDCIQEILFYEMNFILSYK